MREARRKVAGFPPTSTSSTPPSFSSLPLSFSHSPWLPSPRMAFDSPLHTIPTQRRSYASTSDLEMASMEEGTHRPRAGPSSPPRSIPQRVLAMNPRDMGDLFASLESTDGEHFVFLCVVGRVVVARKEGREKEEGEGLRERARRFPSLLQPFFWTPSLSSSKTKKPVACSRITCGTSAI